MIILSHYVLKRKRKLVIGGEAGREGDGTGVGAAVVKLEVLGREKELESDRVNKRPLTSCRRKNVGPFDFYSCQNLHARVGGKYVFFFSVLVR